MRGCLIRVAALLGACAFASSGAWASEGIDDPGASIYMHGKGAVLACASCHGRSGAGAVGPRLAGLPAAYVGNQLRNFRDGARKNSQMHAEASHLDAAGMRAVADYVAGLNPPPTPPVHGSPDEASARLLTLGDDARGIPACISCHGADLLGGGPAIPPLVGQSEAYLKRQLHAFRDGSRMDGNSGIMNRIGHGLQDEEISRLAALIATWPGTPMAVEIRDDSGKWNPALQDPNHFTPPDEVAVPASPQLAKLIRQGEDIFVDTPGHAAKFTGNALSCANCHLERGRSPTAAPMWAALPHFPMYRKKNHRINTIQMRMQGCFRYSENGTPPPVDGQVMNALTAYLHWLSAGMPMGVRPKAAGFPKISPPPGPPDRTHGRQVFMARCAMCHGQNGQGRVLRGRRLFPPLWGPASFNWGAGMHRVDKAASFIKFNMPYGAGGSLSDHDAWDVAAYVDSHPRPQDPRFTGDVTATTERFHKKKRIDFYGQSIDGQQLGAPGTLSSWVKQHG